MEKQIKDRLTSLINSINSKALFYGLVLLFGAVALYTFRDYGTTWDEEVQFIYGEYIIRWYQTFFNDRSATNFSNLFVYGGLFDTIANLLIRVSPVGIFETRHLVNAAFGLLGIVAVWKIGSLVSGRATGLVAALLLLLTPAYYGHAFFNPKDIPFAALATLALYFILRAAREVPRVPVSLCVKTGLAIGAALGVRVGGCFLVGYLVLFWFGRLLWTQPAGAGGWSRPVMTCLGRVGLVILVAWPMMLLFWPWAQLSPLQGPIEAFLVAARFPWDGAMRFRGGIVNSLDLPWDYLPTWFLITLPEAVFVGCLAGMVALVPLLRRRERFDRSVAADVCSLLFAALFPFGAVLALRPVMYDAQRQFLFVLPVLALLAAWGLVAFLNRAGLKSIYRWTVAGVVALLLVVTIVDMVRLHPYQHIYFNRLFAGGLASAAANYETDYWGASYKEGIETLVRHYRPSDPRPIVIKVNCGNSFQVDYWLVKNVNARRYFVVDQSAPDPDIILTTDRPYCPDVQGAGRLLFTVNRFGAPLMYAYEVHPRGVYVEAGVE